MLHTPTTPAPPPQSRTLPNFSFSNSHVKWRLASLKDPLHTKHLAPNFLITLVVQKSVATHARTHAQHADRLVLWFYLQMFSITEINANSLVQFAERHIVRDLCETQQCQYCRHKLSSAPNLKMKSKQPSLYTCVHRGQGEVSSAVLQMWKCTEGWERRTAFNISKTKFDLNHR